MVLIKNPNNIGYVALQPDPHWEPIKSAFDIEYYKFNYLRGLKPLQEERKLIFVVSTTKEIEEKYKIKPIPLDKYEHPETNAVYVFGPDKYAEFVKDIKMVHLEGDYITIPIDNKEMPLFSYQAVCIIIWDRRMRGFE